MSEHITTKAGTYSVPCFGNYLEGDSECGACPLARDCSIVKDAKLKESVEKTQKAPLNAPYLVFENSPELKKSKTLQYGPGLCHITYDNALELNLAKVPGLNPGYYTNPLITVDEFGRVTDISSEFSQPTDFNYNSGSIPQVGQILGFDGSRWSPQYITPSISSIREAPDYDDCIPPTTGQVLAWNGGMYAPTDLEVAQSKATREIVASGRTEITQTTQNIIYEDPDNPHCVNLRIPWKDKPRHLIQYSVECLSEPPHSWINETFNNGFCFEMQFQPNSPVFLHWVTRNV